MLELSTLARPYAEAVFKRAKESGTAVKWSDMLAFLSGVMANEQLSLADANPRVERERFTHLLMDICEGQLSEEGQNLVKLLIQNNRLNLSHQISLLFEQLRAEDEGYIDVDVKSVYPLSDDDQQQLVGSLEKNLNKKVRLHVVEDTSLIGGVLIRAGDKVIDGTIRGQLQQLAHRLGS